MPLKLSVGLSRKVGQPNFGSVGAWCQIESELDPIMLEFDVDSLRQRIRDTYEICSDSVNGELLRQARRSEANQSPAVASDDVPVNRHAAGNGQQRRRRPATPAQLRAIRSIAAEINQDLDLILSKSFPAERIENLSVTEASQLIDYLRTVESGVSEEL